ncbi:hypothetical protein [Ascidiimonas sp. W6]|uniref:hypothetical protein n=1 Tax=Ascidiimonas meishanensis TaxID=3128903 RepID=UPI0030EE871C
MKNKTIEFTDSETERKGNLPVPDEFFNDLEKITAAFDKEDINPEELPDLQEKAKELQEEGLKYLKNFLDAPQKHNQYVNYRNSMNNPVAENTNNIPEKKPSSNVFSAVFKAFGFKTIKKERSNKTNSNSTENKKEDSTKTTNILDSLSQVSNPKNQQEKTSKKKTNSPKNPKNQRENPRSRSMQFG